MVFTFLKARGVNVGNSLVEDDQVRNCTIPVQLLLHSELYSLLIDCTELSCIVLHFIVLKSLYCTGPRIFFSPLFFSLYLSIFNSSLFLFLPSSIYLIA